MRDADRGVMMWVMIKRARVGKGEKGDLCMFSKVKPQY